MYVSIMKNSSNDIEYEFEKCNYCNSFIIMHESGHIFSCPICNYWPGFSSSHYAGKYVSCIYLESYCICG